MKKILVLVLTLFAFQISFGQQKKKEKWHPFSKVPDLSFFFEGNSQFRQITDQNTLGLGVKGAVVWNPNNAIGFTFSSTVNKFSPSFESDSSVYLKNVLTGLFYEYMIKPNNKVHFTIPIASGVGETYYDWRELDANGAASFPYNEKYYFYIQPAVKIEINIAERWRVNAGLAYLYVPETFAYRGVRNTDVSGLGIHVGVRYGKFFW